MGDSSPRYLILNRCNTLYMVLSNMNEKFWNTYYTSNEHDINKPSSFARFIHQQYLKHTDQSVKIIADLGSGNCRDSFFFSEKGSECYAIDFNLTHVDSVPNCQFIKQNAVDVMKNDTLQVRFDIIYMRWFLHAMPYADAIDVFESSVKCMKDDGLMCIEVRSLNDHLLIKESVYDASDKSYTTTHKRWPFSMGMLEKLSKENKCEIIYQNEGYFSENENTETHNPLLIRFVVKKTRQ
jgi:tellurite methyltransferase